MQPFARLRQRFRLRCRRPGDGGRRLAPTVQKYLDPRAALRRRCTKGPRPSAPERRQRALDVLASPERIDPVVDAAAGIREAVETSYLHLVIGAARRADPEIAKKFVGRIVRDDIEDFGAAPPAPQIDLVLVARAPTESGFAFEHGGGLPLADGLASLLARRMATSFRPSRHFGFSISWSPKGATPGRCERPRRVDRLQSRPTVATSHLLGNTPCARMHKI